ncbi:TPA: hypothetical protein QC181_003400 [Bacillus cereus]|nr:hypothetical protein [Bacillus cereus]
MKKQSKYLHDVLVLYLNTLYLNKEVLIVLDQVEYETVIENVLINKEGRNVYLVVETQTGTLKVKVVESTFARFEGYVLYMESDIHDLMIEAKGKQG